jgi:hypothetical protein
MSISITKHVYLLVKVNKCDKQYLIKDFLPLGSILTERVKVEAFKGYSSAYNLAEYFRLRGTTSWKSGKQVTGLWKSPHPGVFYGDHKENNTKTLLLFKYKNDRQILLVYSFPIGFYPNKQTILKYCDKLSNGTQ